MGMDNSLADAQSPEMRGDDLQFADGGVPRWRMATRNHGWQPPTDVYETDDTLVVRVEIAGMREDDFSIELDGRTLRIRGVRPDIQERRAFHQMEIRFGEFICEFILPIPVVATEVGATYNNGFLRLVFPKARPRQIIIKED